MSPEEQHEASVNYRFRELWEQLYRQAHHKPKSPHDSPSTTDIDVVLWHIKPLIMAAFEQVRAQELKRQIEAAVHNGAMKQAQVYSDEMHTLRQGFTRTS
jgi:hypothetical protein